MGLNHFSIVVLLNVGGREQQVHVVLPVTLSTTAEDILNEAEERLYEVDYTAKNKSLAVVNYSTIAKHLQRFKEERGLFNQPDSPKSKNQKQIEQAFTYHAPKGDQADRYQKLRDEMKKLAYLIDELVPDGREKSTAFTKLEEASMWANKGIALEK